MEALTPFRMGLAAPLDGVRFMRANPKLMKYFAVPVAINTLVYSLGAWFFYSNLSALLHWIFQDPETWYMKLAFYALGFVIAAVFSLVLIFTFTAVGMILAGPFMEVVSEKVDEIRLGRKTAPQGTSLVADVVRSLGTQVKKIVLFLLIQGGCLLFHFLPVIGNIFATVMQTVVAFFFLAWEFWDFPMDVRRMDFARKKDLILRYKATALGFGAVCFVYMLIPVFNFIMMPASVAGATILVSKLLGEEPLPPTGEVPEVPDLAIPTV
ncbi:MAG: EI24 domain-containing protein [Deltaproteobacteria bacterium]|nr:EI24 domain-containing protein [Deltaproteobacteria bacterium]